MFACQLIIVVFLFLRIPHSILACECLMRNSEVFNSHCIQKCLSETKKTTVSSGCNVTDCVDVLSDRQKNAQSVSDRWELYVLIEEADNGFSVKLSKTGQVMLSLNSDISFHCNITFLPLKPAYLDLWRGMESCKIMDLIMMTYSDYFELLQFVQLSQSATFENVLNSSNHQAHLEYQPVRYPTALFTNCSIASSLQWTDIRWPLVLKINKSDVDQQESVPRNFMVRYGGKFIPNALFAEWSCPIQWSGVPTGYEIWIVPIFQLAVNHSQFCENCYHLGLQCDDCWVYLTAVVGKLEPFVHTYDRFTYSAVIIDYSAVIIDSDASLKTITESVGSRIIALLFKIRAVSNCGTGPLSEPVKVNLSQEHGFQHPGLLVIRYVGNLSAEEKLQILQNNLQFVDFEGYLTETNLNKLRWQVIPIDVESKEENPLGESTIYLSRPVVMEDAYTQELRGGFHIERDIVASCKDVITGRVYGILPLKDDGITHIVSYVRSEAEVTFEAEHIIERKAEMKNLLCFPLFGLILWSEHPFSEPLEISVHYFKSDKAAIDANNLQTGYFHREACNGARIVSSAMAKIQVDVNQENLILIAEQGFVMSSIDGTVCKLLATAAEMPAYELDQIFSLAATKYQLYFLTHQWPGIHIFDMETGNISVMEEIFKRRSKLFEDDLDKTPGFSSHTMTEVPLDDQIKGISLFDVTSGIQPPLACLFPKIGDIRIEAVARDLVRVETDMRWDDSDSCRNMSRPQVNADVQYGIIYDIPQNKSMTVPIPCTHPGYCQCDVGAVACKHVLYHTSNSTAIHQINTPMDKTYLFLVELFPYAYDQDLRSKWLGLKEHGDNKKAVQIYLVYEPKTIRVTKIILTVVLPIVLAMLLILCAAVHIVKRRYASRAIARLSLSQITKVELLGTGNFGEVWKAEVTTSGKVGRSTEIVAAKILKPSAGDREKRQFIEEAMFMAKMDHEHILHPVGICMESTKTVLALEFVNAGSVVHLMGKPESRDVLRSSDLIKITSDIAKACLYLEEHGYVHRDISAKNCLVSTNTGSLVPKVVKLADFGLTIDVKSSVGHGAQKVRDKDLVLPIPYTAPESLKWPEAEFSAKSDVWSFGIFIWAMDLEEIELWACAEKKNLLDRQNPCGLTFPEAIEAIMAKCWSYDPGDRPSFKQLLTFLRGAGKQMEKKTYLGSAAAESLASASQTYDTLPVDDTDRKPYCQQAYTTLSSMNLPSAPRVVAVYNMEAGPGDTKRAEGHLKEELLQIARGSDDVEIHTPGNTVVYSTSGDQTEKTAELIPLSSLS